MIITFADKKFARLVSDDRKMIHRLGKIRAVLLRRRLAQLEDADSVEELRDLPGNFHELKHDRKGQWACDLEQPYRLLFIPKQATGVVIIEIVNYHKEN